MADVKLLGTDSAVWEAGENVDYIWTTQWVASATGILTSIKSYTIEAGRLFRAAIYADNGSNYPSTLLAESAELTSVLEGWVSATGLSVNVVNGTKYWLANLAQVACCVFKTNAGSLMYYKAQSYGAFPNPHPAGGTSGAYYGLQSGYGTLPVVGRSFGFIIG